MLGIVQLGHGWYQQTTVHRVLHQFQSVASPPLCRLHCQRFGH